MWETTAQHKPKKKRSKNRDKKNMFSPLAGKLILDPAYTRTEKDLMQQKRKRHRARQKINMMAGMDTQALV